MLIAAYKILKKQYPLFHINYHGVGINPGSHVRMPDNFAY